MNGDEQMRRMFEQLEFPGEPPATARAADYVALGQRRLRRRRIMAWSGGVVGAAAIATGVSVALPTEGLDRAHELGVAGGGEAPAVKSTPTVTPTPTRTPTPESTAGQDESDLPFPQTRQLLLDTAVEHFDPEREHLPGESTGFSGGYNAEGANVGSKLAWTVAGESGMGMVRVAVTSPGYTSDDYALEGFGWDIGCEINSDTCTERIVDGRRVWVAESDSETDLELGVMLERADGSLVGVGVYSQFGNNSLQPVSAMDITLEQAIAFVTDPDLHVDEAEVADAVEESASRPGRTEGATRAPDPTSTVG